MVNTPRIASGYTTRVNYYTEYRKRHREAINARKRAWRKARKASLVKTLTPKGQATEETGKS